MKKKHSEWVLLVGLALAMCACHKQDPAAELEKTAVAIDQMEKTSPAKSAEESGDFDPSKYTPPAKQLREAISDYKAGKMEDAVTRLQLLRAQPTLTPQQRMAVQDSVASVMAEIYALAEKGDPKAIAAKAQYEKMQSGQR